MYYPYIAERMPHSCMYIYFSEELSINCLETISYLSVLSIFGAIFSFYIIIFTQMNRLTL